MTADTGDILDDIRAVLDRANLIGSTGTTVDVDKLEAVVAELVALRAERDRLIQTSLRHRAEIATAWQQQQSWEAKTVALRQQVEAVRALSKRVGITAEEVIGLIVAALAVPVAPSVTEPETCHEHHQEMYDATTRSRWTAGVLADGELIWCPEGGARPETAAEVCQRFHPGEACIPGQNHPTVGGAR